MRRRQAQFHIYLETTILDRLRELAKEEGRTTTELIREAVAELLKDREARRRGKKTNKTGAKG